MTLRLLLPVVALASLGGCVFARVPLTTSRPASQKSAVKASSRPECKPSQYWDGERCRHKGKGKGARKHDD